MPIYRLTDKLLFPPVHLSEPDGLLAIGGDLSAERLILAYRSGIFPWFNEEDPILWWSPDPRLVIIPSEFSASRSLRQRINSGRYRVTVDEDFEGVIDGCACTPRGREHEGTWITGEMREAYVELHRRGHAHSFETREAGSGELVGGLYGVELGRAFFGESMFHRATDASKVALAALVEYCLGRGIGVIDCQVYNRHLESLGARLISRKEFIKMITSER